jgi:hypothetical protein
VSGSCLVLRVLREFFDLCFQYDIRWWSLPPLETLSLQPVFSLFAKKAALQGCFLSSACRVPYANMAGHPPAPPENMGFAGGL